jgi:mono/diheme cytochrome c family protein
MMRKRWFFVFALAAWPQGLYAQPAPATNPLNDTQKQGRLLYEQSCGICHTKPTLISPLYGPALSKESLEGREDVLRTFIANGTTRMPGFKTMYQPAQIDAIVQYLKTVPKPAAEPEAAPRAGGPRVED